MFEYNLFEYSHVKEYQFEMYDGFSNLRHIVVWALSFSDALEEARKKALALGYATPYTWGHCDVFE